MISETKPNIFEYLNNDNYYYNYNITPIKEVITEEDGITKEVEKYKYVVFKLRGKPNYNECAKAVIRDYISVEDEFSLINDYNAYVLGVLIDKQIKADYKQYLEQLQTIKSNVKKDFGIE